MENIIEITNVRKIYRTYQKKSGLKNMIKNIIYPDFKDFIAVDDMSFCIRKGDIVGYIGPNGAGKSTTIKMLTGILMPTSGMIKVFGKDPLKYRKENSKHIGIRAHHMKVVEDNSQDIEDGENIFEMTVVKVIENSFTYNIHIKNCDNENNLSLQMEVDKNIEKVKVGQKIRVKFEKNSVFDF